MSPNFLNEPRVYTGHLSLFLYPSFFWRDREKEKDAQYIPEVHSKSLGNGLWARTNIKRGAVLKYVEGFLLEKNVTILENYPKCGTYSEWKENDKVYNLAGPIELVNHDCSN